MDFTHLEDHFVESGGQFLTSAYNLNQRMAGIKAYLFDWDGVFNDGRKTDSGSSNYSEIDVAGLFLLRFGHFLEKGTVPRCGIITGEENILAHRLAGKLRFNQVYQNSKDKALALDDFLHKNALKPEEVCYVFDDVLDIPVARKCAIRIAIGRLANPMLMEYFIDQQLVDYITACQGHENAVRESCELLLSLMGKQFEVIDKRINQGSEFENFIEKSRETDPQIFQFSNHNFVPIETTK